MNKVINIFKENTMLQILLLIWFIIGIIVLNHIPYEHFCHDCAAHWDYTKIIVNEHRLPKPNEGWEAHQPPVFYLIASLIAGNIINSNLAFHVNCVRVLSLFFGAITISVLYFFLKQFTENKRVQFIVLLFLITTPKFIFLFSTYNNDSLATMLSIILVLVSYNLYKKWSFKLSILLSVIGIIGLYSKITVLVPVLSVILICARNLLSIDKPLVINEKKLIKILLISIIAIIPWAVINNYQTTGKLFPALTSLNTKNLPPPLHFDSDKSLAEIVLPVSPVIDFRKKFSDPLARPWPGDTTKKNDYWSFNYITSVYGEHDFNSPAVGFLWAILLIHVFVYIVSITAVFRSTVTKLSGGIILLAHLAQIVHIVNNPYSCNMDFRYISWIWLPWLILYVYALLEKNKWYSPFLYKLMAAGIILHFYFIATVIVG